VAGKANVVRAMCRYGRIATVVVLLAAGCGNATGTGTTPGDPLTSAAPADLTTVIAASVLADEYTGAKTGSAELTGPDYVLHFDWLAAAATIDWDDGNKLGLESGLSPAPGHEFLIAHTPDKSDPAPLTGATDTTVGPSGVAIRVGSQTRHIDKALGSNRLLLVSVPRGADAVLQVSSRGRTQSLSLRTGKRGNDAISLYYPFHKRSLTNGPSFNIALPSFHPVISLGVIITEEALQPFLSDQGWAPPGKAWLALHGYLNLIADDLEPKTVVEFDVARSFRLTAGGATLRPPPGKVSIAHVPNANEPGYGVQSDLDLVFSVADTFTTGKLTITPAGTCQHCSLTGRKATLDIGL
jgi:hypothetical protein